MAVINNIESNTLISGTNSNDSITNRTGRFDENGNWRRGGGSNVTINSGRGNDTISNEVDSTTYNILINTGSGNDYVYNGYGNKTTIYGGTGDDYILNDNAPSPLVYAGDGNDTVSNWASWDAVINLGEGDDSIRNLGQNVSIYAGKGNDTIYNDNSDESSNVVFRYNSGDGNDKIFGFRADSTLSIGGGPYSTKKSGSNVIVTVGEGKISLMGAASLSKLNIKGTKPTTTKLTVTNSTKSPVTIGSAIKTVNASSRTKAVKITGNSLANTITGGSGKDTIYGGKGNDSILGGAGNDRLYGQKGNDTLWGGKGNDSLYGGSGNDTFIYKAGEGTDKIFDYSSGDMLKILKANGKVGSFTKSKFSDGTLSLTISGGGQVILDDVSKGDTFNINNTSYKISGSKLVKK